MASRPPYPGYSPNLKLDVIGGMCRDCYVLDVRSLGKLTPDQHQIICDKLTALGIDIQRTMLDVESVVVVAPDQFDPMLRDGLRL